MQFIVAVVGFAASVVGFGLSVNGLPLGVRDSGILYPNPQTPDVPKLWDVSFELNENSTVSASSIYPYPWLTKDDKDTLTIAGGPQLTGFRIENGTLKLDGGVFGATYGSGSYMQIFPDRSRFRQGSSWFEVELRVVEK